MATRPGKRPPPDLPSQALRPDDSLPGPAEPVLVGRIVGAWGVRGWVRIAPFNDPRLSLLLQLPVWWLRSDARLRGTNEVRLRGPHEARLRAWQIESAKPHGAGEIVAKLAGIDDRDAAQALDGIEVFLSREEFPAPQVDEIYWADLIGCRVLDPDGGSLGTIVAIDDQPAHPVLRLSDEGAEDGASAGGAEDGAPAGGAEGGERLIPLVAQIILSIDLAARVVVADWRRDY